ncbi:MAG: hypothetical protein KGI25_05375 [Thaumarchaeota archaeon]|nr:hypothetical protein [Nitrososphaerota archaeon]
MQSILLGALFTVSLLVLVIPSSWAQEDQSITINTPKSNYGPGDTVNITGTVNGGTPGQLVAIQIKDPKGNLILIRTVQSDQNGNFALSFKVPTTASSGNLNITASSRVNGFVVTQSTAIATPVPEFPTSGLVLVAGISSLVLYGLLSNRGFGLRQGFGA